MRILKKLTCSVIVGGVFVVAFSAAEVRAQGGCPPGYYPTGGGNSGWHACAPMGPMDEPPIDEAPGPDSPPAEPDRFMALIGHRDTSALWVSTGYPTRSDAETAALGACQRQISRGCFTAWWGYNAFHVAIVQDAAGVGFLDGNIDKSEARSNAMPTCRSLSSGCNFVKFITNSSAPRDSFPKGRPPLHKYVAVAWPESAPRAQRQRKVWLVAGLNGYEKTVATAVLACSKDTGSTCIEGHVGRGGVLVRFADQNGTNYWIDAANGTAATKRMADNCPSRQSCRMIQLYQADQNRSSIIDEDRADQPLRGCYAIAAAPGRQAIPKVALVTGASNREAAQQKTVALCTEASKSKCLPFPDADDWGAEQFIGFARDAGGKTRIEFGYSPEQVSSKMKVACKSENVNCSNWQIFDLARTQSQMIQLKPSA